MTKKNVPRVQLLGCGTILREVIAAAELLEKDFGVAQISGAAPASMSCVAMALQRNAGTSCIPPNRRDAAMSRNALPLIPAP